MADEVLAIQVTTIHTIADGRQITFTTAFAEDMGKDRRNALLDTLAEMSERQWARAQRPLLVKDIAKHKETLAQYQEDMARLEVEWPGKLAALQEAVAEAADEAKHDLRRAEFLDQMHADYAELKKKREGEFNAGYMEHVNSGRGGEYKPKGHRETNLARLDSALKQAEEMIKNALVDFEVAHQKEIDAVKAAIPAAEQERQVAMDNLGISEKRYLQAIENLELQLSEVDRLLEG